MQRANELKREAMPKIGDTWDNGTIRINRYADSLRVMHVADAGRRGKKCRELACVRLDMQPVDVHMLVGGLVTLAMLEASMETMKEAMLVHGVREDYIFDEQHRCVDVEKGRMELKGEHVEIDVGDHEVVINDLDDQNNLPAAMTRKRTDAKKAGAWIKQNLAHANHMRFGELLRAIREDTGVSIHRWCRMD